MVGVLGVLLHEALVDSALAAQLEKLYLRPAGARFPLPIVLKE